MTDAEKQLWLKWLDSKDWAPETQALVAELRAKLVAELKQ